MNKSSHFSLDFYKLLFTNIFSNLGEIIFNVTVLTLIYAHTKSVFESTLVIVISMLAKVIGSYIGSNYIFHKFSIRNVLIYSESLRIIFAIIFIFLIPIHHFENIYILFILVFLINISNSFFTPGSLALIPIILSKEKLIQGNSWFSISNQLTQTIGWLVAVPIVNFLGNIISIIVYIFLFIISLLLILFMRADSIKRDENNITNFTKALKFIRDKKIVRDITMMDLLETSANIIWMPTFLLTFTLEILNEGEHIWGIQGATYTLGSLLGSIILIKFSKSFNRLGGYTIVLSAFIMFLLTIGYSLNSLAIIAIIICFIDGPAYQIRETVQKSILQTEIPLDIQSSVYSTINTLIFGSYIIWLLLGSYMADIFGVQWIFVFAAILYFLSTVIAFTSNEIRRYRILNE
ncbi:MFS transporter [Abyssicoccus albus]|uniref:Transmembrane secretion effector n=1 Tax=Abyssicoccus albus TaxID=1817405 RepID=A0A3N5BLS3_9BACL|nr:MFS transporter [Abyssicoccus albus]RPF57519.1 transmembrane secretion effector [Abyssicoccus albus]